MSDVDKLKARLLLVLAAEAKAWTRCKRADTIFEKYYLRRVRIQKQLLEIDRQVQDTAHRLLKGSDND